MRRLAIGTASCLVIGAVAVMILLFVDLEPILRDRAMRPAADGCRALGFSQARCDGVIARAIEQARVDPSSVAAIELGRPDGTKAGIGGYVSALARLHLTDGTVIDQEVWCIGVAAGPRPWCISDDITFPAPSPEAHAP